MNNAAKILIIVLSIYASYLLLAFSVYLSLQRRLKKTPRFNLDSLMEGFKQLNSVIICSIACVLPHRVRELFVFGLHFVLHSVKHKLLLLAKSLMAVILSILFTFVYFIGLPLTIALQKLSTEKPQCKHPNILRRY
jgi:uncharacterized protein YneF (UPF0154 family)